jgi:large subunit ribosomal protein L17
LIRNSQKFAFVSRILYRRLKQGLKSSLEKLVEKAKRENEANKNYLLRYTTDSQLVKIFFTKIGPAAKERQGGYLRIKKIGERASDGAEMAILEWTIAQK